MRAFVCADASVHAGRCERSCVLMRAFTQGDANVRVWWGMEYRMERRRRGGNIAGGGAERRNPRIATPQPIRTAERWQENPYWHCLARANIILYIGICLGEMECWGIAQRKRSFSLSTKVRVFFKPTSLVIRKNYIFFIF